MTKRIVAVSALALMLAAGTAFAQTTYPTTDTTGTTGSTGATTATDPGTTGTVGVPNTGAGGNVLENEAVLGTSAAFALAAAAALMARRKRIA